MKLSRPRVKGSGPLYLPGHWRSADGRFCLSRDLRPRYSWQSRNWRISVPANATSDEERAERLADQALLQSVGLHGDQCEFPTLRQAAEALYAVAYAE